jgi:hypothetical protein
MAVTPHGPPNSYLEDMLVSTRHNPDMAYSRLVLVQELVGFAALIGGGRGGSS